MAFIPLSLILELVLISIGFLLMEYKLLGRMASFGSFMFALVFATDPQVYIDVSGSTITTATAAYPSAILAPLVFVLVIFEYMSIASIFELLDRDMVGRRRRKT